MATLKLKTIGSKLSHFGHPVKSRIIQFIVDNDNMVYVNEIYTKLKLEQSVTSSLLAQLRKDGIVKAKKTKKDGRRIFYSVNREYISEMTEKLLGFISAN